MAKCNFCNLEDIRREAAAKGWKVTIQHSGKIAHKSKDIFVHPDDLELEYCSIEEKEKYFTAWCMELPDQCSC